MFGKISLKQLTITFFILLMVVMGVNYLDEKKGDRSFHSQLVQVDPNNITTIAITAPGEEQEVKLYKDGDQWRVSKGTNDYLADQSTVSGMTRLFENMKAERVASWKKESWAKFELTDTAAVRVLVKAGDDEVADLMVGKFSYSMPRNQQMGGMRNPYMQGKMTSYVRFTDEKEVYAVDGFLKGSLNQDVDAIRNKVVIKGNRSNWTKITMTHPADSSFTLQKEGDQWMMNGAEADSASIVSFLGDLTYVNGRTFVTEQPSGQPTHQLKIEGTQAPIEIKAYGDAENQVVTSSLNPGAYFNAGEGDLFNDLFTKRPKTKE